MKTNKVTFKTENPTGRFKAFDHPIYYIKLNGKECGTIDAEDFTIRLMVVKDDINSDGNPNCVWMWRKLTIKPASLEEAKAFLVKNIDTITDLVKIYQRD